MINPQYYLKFMRYQKKRYAVTRSKYAKIPLKTKLKFLRKIILEGFSIRDSATIYDINYSTAKTLMRQYRANSFQMELNQPIDHSFPEELDLKKRIRCSYRLIEIQSQVKHQLLESSDNSGGLNLAGNGVHTSFCSNSAKVETGIKQKMLFPKQIEIISSISFA